MSTMMWGGQPPQAISGLHMNPTGTNGNGGISPAWGSNPPTATPFLPPTGSPGNYGYGTSGNPNPTGPTTSMNPGTGTAPPVTGGGGAGSSNNEQLNGPFGSGLGPQVQAFLNSNGGYNSALTQQNVDAQIAAMQHQAQVGAGNIESNLGAAGINPNSSSAALETGDYWSNVTAQENAITAQEYFSMWQSSMANEVNVLDMAGQASANLQDIKEQKKPTGLEWAEFGVDTASLAFGAYQAHAGGG